MSPTDEMDTDEFQSDTPPTDSDRSSTDTASGPPSSDHSQHRSGSDFVAGEPPALTRADGDAAIVVSRGPNHAVSTDEIAELARSAGYTVADSVTQPGRPDTGSYLGEGRLRELVARTQRLGVSTVIVDDPLSPGQHRAMEQALPAATRVLDRYRLVLDIFETGAGSRRASLQVELAQLRYELPRLIETSDEGMLNRFTESGTPVYDVRDRISRLERELRECPDPSEQFRRRRRAQGFDLVTIAGYTNAGKSTLLHRLADDLSLEPATSEFDGDGDGDTDVPTPDGAAKDATASVADRLFETLETTTRRATIDGRPVLCTDTVGYVDDLPHDLVASFSATLSEAEAADAVVLLVDASDSLERYRRRLTVSFDVLDQQGVDPDRIVVGCNKIDRLEPDERAERLAVVRDHADAPESDPIPVSVHRGTNLDALRAAIADRLPTRRTTIEVPAGDEAMALVSRAYDRVDVDDVTYRHSVVEIRCRGRPEVIERLEGQAGEIQVN